MFVSCCFVEHLREAVREGSIGVTRETLWCGSVCKVGLGDRSRSVGWLERVFSSWRLRVESLQSAATCDVTNMVPKGYSCSL